MDEVKIEWKQTNFSNVKNLPDADYYGFSRGANLLYIGISYHQDVVVEIRQTLTRLNINTNGLSIWLGDITESTYGRITERIVKDAECLMIGTNQPVKNTQCINTYTGRNNFKVKTSGCSLIRSCVRCENNQVYLTCR